MCKALIVEDSAVFRRSLNDILRTHFPHLRVEEAEDGPSALEKLESLVPDLVFMDIHMPRGNGLDLTRTIKAYSWATTVVILTSYDLPEYRLAAFDSGASHFLAKGSATEAEILSLVASILGGT